MKCYYEVLGVARDVNDDDLKKAYRKLALKWHPDKNLDNAVEAKEQFQLVQQAYEVLSDPQERAWYDNHRESILRGAGSDYKDNSLDVFQYFTPSCFKGYGDDENGFYAVYREVFNKLAAEDSEYMTEEDSDFETPTFGNAQSSYEDVVHPFYAYWQSYSTRKSYAWLDIYDLRDAPNRRVVRIAEKENKKVREKARKERNEEIRNLVAFVRKRDKRVQAYIKVLEERSAENARKSEERRKRLIKERQEEMKNYKETEWAKFSGMSKELEAIEANLAAEFGESDTSSYGESDSEEKEEENATVNSLYCVACNKVFKTEKAFANHENSKKHKENVEVLKTSVLDEEEKLAATLNCMNGEDPVNGSEIDESIEIFSNLSSEEELKPVEKQSKKKKKKQTKLPNFCDLNGSDNVDFEIPSSQSKKQRRKQREVESLQKQESSGEEEEIEVEINKNSEDGSVTEENAKFDVKKGKGKKGKKQNKVKMSNEDQNKCVNEDMDNVSVNNKVKNKKTNEVKKKSNKESVSSIQDTNHCCVTCHSEFPSKNKLFDHLKKTGHSVYIPHSTVSSVKDRVEEKIKGKGKKK